MTHEIDWTELQQFTVEAFTEARACYEAAIARDPLFARPFFGLGDLLFAGARFGVADPAAVVPRAREAVVGSLELDDAFGETHALLGTFRALLDFDWVGADAAFQRALELSPGSHGSTNAPAKPAHGRCSSRLDFCGCSSVATRRPDGIAGANPAADDCPVIRRAGRSSSCSTHPGKPNP